MLRNAVMEENMLHSCNLEDVLYPVELHPISANVTAESSVSIPNRQAVVNMDNKQVVGVVGHEYKLITNKKALEAGRNCCNVIYPETKSSDWEVNAVSAPASKSFCHIDLALNSKSPYLQYLLTEKTKENREAFGIFLRITNSYDTSRALGFCIGLYRIICTNGWIDPDIVIRFDFAHTQNDLGKGIRFNVDKEQLTNIKNKYLICFSILRKFRIDPSDFTPTLMGILQLKPPKAVQRSNTYMTTAAIKWRELESHIENLNSKYIMEHGENAYALFNSITEFTSHPLDNQHVRRDRNSLQRIAGKWLDIFSRECEQPDFTLEKYLQGIVEMPTEISQQDYR